MRIIAFAGPKSAGKDTAARYLFARDSLLRSQMFKHMNFADTLKQALETLFGFTQAELNDPNLKEVEVNRWPYKSPRHLMQNFANLMRTMYDPKIFVIRWLTRVKLLGTEGCIVVTDLRHPEELEALQELGAKIFYIHNPVVEEARRIGRESGDPLWSDSSEEFADLVRKHADEIIENDGVNLTALYDNVHQAVMRQFGDWKEWQELTKGTL